MYLDSASAPVVLPSTFACALPTPRMLSCGVTLVERWFFGPLARFEDLWLATWAARCWSQRDKTPIAMLCLRDWSKLHQVLWNPGSMLRPCGFSRTRPSSCALHIPCSTWSSVVQPCTQARRWWFSSESADDLGTGGPQPGRKSAASPHRVVGTFSDPRLELSRATPVLSATADQPNGTRPSPPSTLSSSHLRGRARTTR